MALGADSSVYCHLLKSNKGTSRPSRLVFFDVETSQRELPGGDIAQDFRYGEALYWRRSETKRGERLERFQIWKPEQFWDWLETKVRKRSRLILSSHNLNIDMVALDAFAHLPDRGYELRSLYVEGMTKIIRWKRDKSTLLFVDNANWWKAPLADLGNMLGFPKLDVNPLDATLEELIPYCQRDVEILCLLWRQWFEFLDKHDLGTWGITMGSQAFKAYTHRFMSQSIFIHNHPRAIELERAAYRGGRVEAFWIGAWSDKRHYKLDVNSMYPALMREHEYPSALVAVESRMSLSKLRRKLRSRCLVAEVEVEVTEPVLPVNGPDGAHYPVGRFRTTLTTPELIYALERNWIISVGRTATYRKASLFREYVDYFYPLKAQYAREGNLVYRTATKLLLNCLYGKFGQKSLQSTIVGQCDSGIIRVERVIRGPPRQRIKRLYLGGQVIETVEGPAGYNSLIAIAAHVTAYGRLYLWELIQVAGPENVIYCDTDSLITNEPGRRNLTEYLDDFRLGALKIELQADQGVIHGKKDYQMCGKRVLKAIPRKAKQVAATTWAFDMWPSIRSLIRKGDLSQYWIRPMTRTMKRRVTWGELQTDGWVTPFRVGL